MGIGMTLTLGVLAAAVGFAIFKRIDRKVEEYRSSQFGLRRMEQASPGSTQHLKALADKDPKPSLLQQAESLLISLLAKVWPREKETPMVNQEWGTASQKKTKKKK